MCLKCGNHILIRIFKLHEELHNCSNYSAAVDISGSNKSQDDESSVTRNKSTNSKVEDQAHESQNFPKFRNVVCQNILQASAANGPAIPAEKNSNGFKCFNLSIM